VEHGESLQRLLANRDLLSGIELLGPEGQVGVRKNKKLCEVAGFCDVVLRYVRSYLADKDRLRIAEFSCGKSYLGIALVILLRELAGKEASLVGVDINDQLVEKCRLLAKAVGLADTRFVASRTIEFRTDEEFDLAVALHACDTATDEAIAKGIELGAGMILAVPCCQNQIRGQIKGGHPLTGMTDFGPIRYRLANLLTDTLRAQFLYSAGYQVEMLEIGSPRLTPKNLCICARKTRRGRVPGRDREYLRLKSFFGVKPKVEVFCPGVIGRESE